VSAIFRDLNIFDGSKVDLEILLWKSCQQE